MKPMAHQTASLKFMAGKKAVMDASSPGTGKTLVQILDFVRQHKKDKKAMLVLCTKSIMQAAWANDIKKFAPTLRVSLAYAKNRDAAMRADADVFIVNHDGVKDLLKYPKAFWSRFGRVVIDEITAYKTPTGTKRSTAAAKLMKHFEWRRGMSGTLGSNGICDVWHPYFLLDDGKHLGKSYFGFRSSACTPVQTGPSAQMIKWVDKPDIETVISSLVSDMTVRHAFEDCVDIPANHHFSVAIQLSAKHRQVYEQMEATCIAQLKQGDVSAVNAASLATKLLQIASGAVYNDSGHFSEVANERYELAIDLAQERGCVVMFYQWKHQLEKLVAEATKRNIKHVVWNPDQPEIEQHFQKGFYDILFAHPQSAGHGLTFTRGSATIWVSPTYNLEHFEQGWKRVHRIGQSKKTETIVIVAENTIDERVYQALMDKKVRMTALLEELKCTPLSRHAA